MTRVVPDYKEIARSNILQASIKVFSQKGFHGATMNEIAKEVGVSKGTLYTYFKSKEDILNEIWIVSSQNILDLKKTYKGRDFTEVLEELYDMMVESPGLQLSFEVTLISQQNEKIRKINQKSYKSKLESMKIFIRDQQENGSVREDQDPDLLAQILTGLYTDVAVQLLIGLDKEEVHKKWIKSVNSILKH
jgi:AcrR family transcriptional regulator